METFKQCFYLGLISLCRYFDFNVEIVHMKFMVPLALSQEINCMRKFCMQEEKYYVFSKATKDCLKTFFLGVVNGKFLPGLNEHKRGITL